MAPPNVLLILAGQERLRQNGVSFNYHYAMSTACAPSRASPSHAHLDADDGKGPLLSIDGDGKPQPENVERYLEADLLDDYGFLIAELGRKRLTPSGAALPGYRPPTAA